MWRAVLVVLRSAQEGQHEAATHPCSLSSKAATAESTPPEIPTATRCRRLPWPPPLPLLPSPMLPPLENRRRLGTEAVCQSRLCCQAGAATAAATARLVARAASKDVRVLLYAAVAAEAAQL